VKPLQLQLHLATHLGRAKNNADKDRSI